MTSHFLLIFRHGRFFLPMFFSFIICIIGLISSCSSAQPAEKIYIGLSKGSGSASYEQYAKWLKSLNPNVECIDLYNNPDPKASIFKCAGLILTGGPDVEPFRYGKAADSVRCEMDVPRDIYEFHLIGFALENKIPILGICRGEQVLNVNFGGSLIVDIPQDYKSSVKVDHKCSDPKDCYHTIDVVPGTLLDSICGKREGMVNSNHHQAIDRLCYMFKVSARSKDGIIEAVEWEDPTNKPFLLAVQWHPERLGDSPYSTAIGKAFLQKAQEYINKQKEFEKLFHEESTSGDK